MKKATPKKTKPAKLSIANKPAGTAVASREKASALKRVITSDLIAARAYNIWEQQGRPPGNDLQNWLLAEQQLQDEVRGFSA